MNLDILTSPGWVIQNLWSRFMVSDDKRRRQWLFEEVEKKQVISLRSDGARWHGGELLFPHDQALSFRAASHCLIYRNERHLSLVWEIKKWVLLVQEGDSAATSMLLLPHSTPPLIQITFDAGKKQGNRPRNLLKWQNYNFSWEKPQLIMHASQKVQELRTWQEPMNKHSNYPRRTEWKHPSLEWPPTAPNEDWRPCMDTSPDLQDLVDISAEMATLRHTP